MMAKGLGIDARGALERRMLAEIERRGKEPAV